MKSLLFAILFLAANAFAGPASSVSLTPSNANPNIGDPFTIGLVVSGNTGEILGFGLDYSVSTGAISFQGFTINPFFGADLGLGDPQISAITFPGDTNPSVTLVTFSFLAKSAGPAVFGVNSDLGDPNEGLFLLSGATADLSRQVTISVQGVATPEPDTLTLTAFAAGLFLALSRINRQRRALSK
jgi:hypothetical protein